MSSNQKKLLVFKRDIEDDDLKDPCYVKFLDIDRNYAIFYKPLIAPKYFKDYLNQNKIELAYEISNDIQLNKYEDKIYTFKSENGVYKVSKGFEIEKKLVLLVDFGMEIKLDLPKYSYEIIEKTIVLKPYKESNKKGYCYVANDTEVNEELRRIMMLTEEVIPNVLNMESYQFKSSVKYKKK